VSPIKDSNAARVLLFPENCRENSGMK
jgi:hypothetical protein